MNITECHVVLDQSQRRISYVDLCTNTNNILFKRMVLKTFFGIFQARLKINYSLFFTDCYTDGLLFDAKKRIVDYLD